MNNSAVRNGDGKLHEAGCGVWDVPDASDVEFIIDAGFGDEAIAGYLAHARPVYDTLNRVLAQLSGVLLLAMTSGKSDLALDHDVYRIALERLSEAHERQRALKAPASAARHHAVLADIVVRLEAAAKDMDALSAILGRDAREAHMRKIIIKLHGAQRLLVAAAQPDANITPVDFSHACCTCSVSGKTSSEKII